MSKRPKENPAVAAAGLVAEQTKGHGLQPDSTAAGQFLQWIDPNAGIWCFRTFPDTGTGPGRNYTGSLQEHIAALTADNAAGRGAFVVVNQGGHKAREITRVRAVFADLDGAPLEPVLSGPLQPHLVVESSTGRYHAYWLLADDLPLAQFKPMQQAIAACFGSDASVCDLPRVMRLPGLVHHKGEPFVSRVIQWNERARYTAAELLQAFPPTPRPQAPAIEQAEGEAIDTGRHDDVVRVSRKLVLAGLNQGEAVATLKAMGDAGRWSREMAPGEIERAVAGALEHLAHGEWAPIVDPSDIFGKQPLPDGVVAVGSLLPAVDLRNLMHARIEPTRFAIAQLVPIGYMTLLGGHGGTGKSLLALCLAAHVAAGVTWAGFAVQQLPALYVSLEDAGELVRLRLRHVIAAYGLDADAVAANLRVVDGTGGETALMTEAGGYGQSKLVTTPTFDALAAAVGDAGLIVIDGASDAFYGNDSDKRQVTAFVRKLVALKRSAAWICLAHIDKAAARFGAMGNSFIGSVAWNNATRARLALTRDGDAGSLAVEKFNLGKKWEMPICLRWGDHGVPMPDMAASGEAAAAAALSDADAVLEAMAAAIADAVSVPTSRVGPATTQRVLENFPELPGHLRGPTGRRKFWAAVTELQRTGKITAEEYMGPGRHPRCKFII